MSPIARRSALSAASSVLVIFTTILIVRFAQQKFLEIRVSIIVHHLKHLHSDQPFPSSLPPWADPGGEGGQEATPGPALSLLQAERPIAICPLVTGDHFAVLFAVAICNPRARTLGRNPACSRVRN